MNENDCVRKSEELISKHLEFHYPKGVDINNKFRLILIFI